MNAVKVKIYEQILKDICNKYDGAEDFFNEKIEELCSHEKLFLEEIIYFGFSVCVLLLAFVALK